MLSLDNTIQMIVGKLIRSLRIAATSLLLILASVGPIYGSELDQKILDIYLRMAFANTSQLIKFDRIPSVSAYCADSTCQPLLVKLDGLLSGAVTIGRTDSENSGADIEILFYPTADERVRSKNQYRARPGEVFEKLIHPNCFVVRSRRGFEVVKVIIGITGDAGSRENLVCIMSELLRGSGNTIKGRYPQYLKEYLALDEVLFANTLRSMALFLAMHVSPSTHPGQDAATVVNELKQNFKLK